METNLQSFRTLRVVYIAISKDAFWFYDIFCWFFSLVINILAAFWLFKQEDGSLVTNVES